MTDLDHPFQSDKLTFIDFIATQQFDVVAKIAQEPVQLPKSLWIAVEAAGERVLVKTLRFKNDHADRVIRFLSLPSVGDPLHPNEIDAVRNLVGGAAIGSVKSGDLAFHATPSFCPG